MAAENHPRNDSRFRIFQEKTVPTETRLAGWAALVQTFGVQAPVRRPSAVSEQHVKASRREERGWTSSTSGTGRASPSATSWVSRCDTKTLTCWS